MHLEVQPHSLLGGQLVQLARRRHADRLPAWHLFTLFIIFVFLKIFNYFFFNLILVSFENSTYAS